VGDVPGGPERRGGVVGGMGCPLGGVEPDAAGHRLGIARGWSDPEIAQALSIRRSTLRTHLRRLFARLGLPGRQALRAWLRAGGLEDPAVAAGLRGEAPWPPVAGDPDGRAMSPLLEDTARICPPFWRTTASAGWIE
jgi:Response regulator containing a CheY-like receiver domain and an HTH DNA-binding domain